MAVVVLWSPLPYDEVRAALPGPGNRFRFRPRSAVLEATGVVRGDGTGTRLVADVRLLPALALPPVLGIALLLLISFSEPVAFVALAVVLLAGLALLPRALRRYRAERDAVLAALRARAQAVAPGPGSDA